MEPKLEVHLPGEAEFINVNEPLERIMLVAQSIADDAHLLIIKHPNPSYRHGLRHKILLPAKNLLAIIENLEEKLDGYL